MKISFDWIRPDESPDSEKILGTGGFLEEGHGFGRFCDSRKAVMFCEMIHEFHLTPTDDSYFEMRQRIKEAKEEGAYNYIGLNYIRVFFKEDLVRIIQTSTGEVHDYTYDEFEGALDDWEAAYKKIYSELKKSGSKYRAKLSVIK